MVSILYLRMRLKREKLREFDEVLSDKFSIASKLRMISKGGWGVNRGRTGEEM